MSEIETKKSFTRKLSWCTTAAVTLLGFQSIASGAIVSNTLNLTQSLNLGDGQPVQPFDIDGNGTIDLAFRSFHGSDGGTNIRFLADGSYNSAVVTPTIAGYAEPLASGDVIGPSSSFSTGGVSLSSSFSIPSGAAPATLTDAIYGFSFQIDGATHYGYFTGVAYDRTTDPIFLTVGTAFWEDVPGTAITVPEPGSLALLAAGAAGLMGYRRRRDVA
ncbi:MAG: PEP-CTERM sorting domain-containing protein [Planctomycetota bacterium]